MTDNPRLAAALARAKHGHPVFPTGVNKRPLTMHGFRDATRDPEQIQTWWRTYPEAGVGLPTGASTEIVVLDVDPRHGGDISLAELERANGSLPACPHAKTGGGGDHYYFRHPGGDVPTVHGFRPGLDFQADGAYVVIPPSGHESGGVYAWVVELNGSPLPLAPPWLLKAAERPSPGGRKEFELGTDGKIPHGQRHDYLVSLAASVVSRTPDISIEQARAVVRAAMHTVTDDDLWPTRDRDISEAVRSAIAKYGRSMPPGPELVPVSRLEGNSRGITLSEADVGGHRYSSEVVRVEDGWLSVCHFRFKDGGEAHTGHDLLLPPRDVPSKHTNEFGETRVRFAGHLYTETQAIEQFRRMCPGALNVRAFVAFLRELPVGDSVTEALRLEADISSDSWRVVAPDDSPNPLTQLLVRSYKPADESTARATYESYRSFVKTTNQEITLRFTAGAPVYQALSSEWRSEPIRPGLDRRGVTKSGKTTDVDAGINVMWGLHPVGLGGDFERSGFRQQEGDESTNLPLHLDEAQGDRRSQERRRHSRSGGLTGRGRGDRSMDWSRGIAPEIVTSNRRREDDGSEYEAGANERRTVSLIDTAEDVRAIEATRPEYQGKGFAYAPGGVMLHILRRPEFSPSSVIRWLEGRRGVDPRQLVVDLGSHLLGLEEVPIPELSGSSPGQQFLSWLSGTVAAYFARRVQGTGLHETEVPVHPELEEMMSVRTLEGKRATRDDQTVEVRVTLPLLLRYCKEMRTAGREPAYSSPHELADLAPYTDQSATEIWPLKGWKKDVGGRTQVYANVRLVIARGVEEFEK
jgi:hypothetical protein